MPKSKLAQADKMLLIELVNYLENKGIYIGFYFDNILIL
ncbi:hypothetical protein X874_1550 [Mannheimia varigena USDA-ARS-USMARC-1312]|nr:hypothetical protein X874_1550 [Mannheimia varigena USDA-ARS-USMARC-1312]